MSARRRRRRCAAALAACLVPASIVLGAAAPGFPATPPLAVVATPDQSVGSPPVAAANQLEAVAAPGTGSAVAVGTVNTGSASAPLWQSLVETLSGGQWALTPVPEHLDVNGVATDNQLAAVSADSPSDVWAVGSYDDLDASGATVAQPLLLHSDGTTWTIPAAVPVAAPSALTASDQLLAVDALSATDVWVAGTETSGGTTSALVEQYDGTAWSVASVPEPGAAGNVLDALGGSGAGDVWAVGSQTATGGTTSALIEHFDGTAWSEVASPAVSGATSVALTGVAAASPTSAVAVGIANVGTAGAPVDVPVILSWDGTVWSAESAPALPSGASGGLDAVAIGAGGAAIAAGSAVSGSPAVSTPIVDGESAGSWQSLAVPSLPSGTSASLAGAAVDPGGDLWAVGNQLAPAAGSVAQTLALGTPAPTTTTVTTATAAPVVGQPLTYVAAVAGGANAGPTGTVAFAVDGTPLPGCGSIAVVSGSASCGSIAGDAGAHVVTAAYSGDAMDVASTGALDLTVAPAATSTTLSAPATSGLGAPIALAATVSVLSPGSTTVTGPVTFTENGTPIASCTAVATTAGGASCTTSSSVAGTTTFGAEYLGATDTAASTSAPATTTVAPATSDVTLSLAPDPSTAGVPAAAGVTVAAAAPAVGVPTGTVTVSVDGVAFPTCSAVPLSNGAALCSVDFPAQGTFTVVAAYSGDANDAPGTSAAWSQTVDAGTLSVSEVAPAAGASATASVLLPVTLDGQVGQATGTLSDVTVSDQRGTEPGWTVTAQLGSDFLNTDPVGPSAENVIPADFLSWWPTVTSPVGDPLTGVSAGLPAVLSSSAPTVLCSAAVGSGGGTFTCGASLSLAVPPYVAAGRYIATLTIFTS